MVADITEDLPSRPRPVCRDRARFEEVAAWLAAWRFDVSYSRARLADALLTTFLEMRSPHELRPKRSADERFRIHEHKEPNWVFNRDLYLAVGEMWRWIDKRSWTDEQWKEYSMAPELRTFGAYHDGTLAGYYELRRDANSGVEIAYLGLLPDFFDRGLGGALLTSAIEEAWRMSPSITRVWVHTCTRDHPRALANYQARGMAIYKVEKRVKGKV